MANTFKNLTSLLNGTTYEFRLTAIGDGSTYTNSPPSTIENFTTLIPLAVPTRLTLTKTTSTITATWTAVEHKSSYKVSYVTGNGTPVEQTVSGESFTLSNLSQGATYSFQVMAVGDGTTYEDSEYCVAASATTLVKLATPQPTVDSTTSQVSVAWSAIVNASGYNVYYKTGNGNYGSAIDVGTNLSYAVTGLQEGVAITFKVEAYTDSPTVYEYSEASSEVTETTQITLVAPSFTLSKTTDAITATWSQVENATGYVVAYKLNGAANFTETAIADPTTTTYSIGSLNEGVTYVFKIKATSSVQDYVDSPYSNTASETTLITLATPSNIVVSDITSTSAKIAWTGDDNATSFKLEYRVSGSNDEWTELN